MLAFSLSPCPRPSHRHCTDTRSCCLKLHQTSSPLGQEKENPPLGTTEQTWSLRADHIAMHRAKAVRDGGEDASAKGTVVNYSLLHVLINDRSGWAASQL